MKIVAKYLIDEALRRSLETEIDLFGKSAFNRYYYATFWIVRDTIAQIDSKWSEPSHAEIPDLLTGRFIKRFRTAIKKADGLGMKKTSNLKVAANTAASELANLMRHAYLLRIQADYKIDAHACKQGDIIILQGTKSSEAAYWPEKAETLTASLLKVAKKIELI
jgi:hypothetical protein